MQPLTPAEQLLHDKSLIMARSQFQADGQAGPILIALNPLTNELGLVSLDGSSKEQLGRFTNSIRQIAPLVIILEAWTTRIDPVKSPTLAEACKTGDVTMIIPPKEALDRKECVLVQFMHKDRRIISNAIITRPKDGKPTLGEWHTVDNAEKGQGFHSCNFDDGKGTLASGIVNDKRTP